MQVTLYTKPNCPECDTVRDALHRLADRYALSIAEVTHGDALFDTLGPGADSKLPIVQAEGLGIGRLVSPILDAEITSYLSARPP